MLVLEDLKGMEEQEVLKHLAENYSGGDSGFSYGRITDQDIAKAKKELKNMEILIAYESVGSWGCDSSSFFLLKDKTDGKLFEVHGSHCSCFEFEGQLDLEETNIKVLLKRALKGNVFCCGGYDENLTKNEKLVNDFVKSFGS